MSYYDDGYAEKADPFTNYIIGSSLADITKASGYIIPVVIIGGLVLLLMVMK